MNENLDNHKISIIIVTYNNLSYTKSCLESIKKYSSELDYEIIVIDNNSSDGTREWLRQRNDIKCVFNEFNLGFPAGCNQGIRLSTGDSILLLNNDVVVTPRWLENLTKALWSEEDVGAAGAVTNSCSYYQSIPVDYKDMDGLIEFADKYNNSDPNKWERRIKLIGFCMIIKKSVIDKIGLLDEIFTPGNFEDDDYSYRIIEAGYKLLLCKDTFIHHYGSASFSKEQWKTNAIMNINYNKFKNKWNFDPVSMNLLRYEIINNITKPLEREMNILDIGCGCGATVLKIKNMYKDANIFGIEKNPIAGKIASSFMHIKIGDVEEIEFDYKENFFDYIILSEVLQYLKQPFNLLKKIKKYLKFDGHIILIIPNAMSFVEIRRLINGDWYYNEELLGQESTKLFTFNDISRVLTKYQYQNVRAEGIFYSTTEEDEVLINKLIDISKQDLRIQYLSNRYIIVADNFKEIETNKLVFLLRRIENDVDISDSISEIAKLINNNGASMESIINSIKKHIVLKDKVINIVKGIYLGGKK